MKELDKITKNCGHVFMFNFFEQKINPIFLLGIKAFFCSIRGTQHQMNHQIK